MLVAALCVAATICAIPYIGGRTIEWCHPSVLVVVAAALVAVTYGLCAATMWAIGVLCGNP